MDGCSSHCPPQWSENEGQLSTLRGMGHGRWRAEEEGGAGPPLGAWGVRGPLCSMAAGTLGLQCWRLVCKQCCEPVGVTPPSSSPGQGSVGTTPQRRSSWCGQEAGLAEGLVEGS